MRRWHVALAGFALYAVGQGVGVQSHALWYLLLGQDGGWSRAALAGGTTLFHLAAAGMGVMVGLWLDQHNGRAPLASGAFWLVLGVCCLAVTPWLWGAYGGFLLLGLGFACLGPVTVGKLLTVYPPGQARTAAMTLATSGTQVGLLLTPATAWLAVHGGRVMFGVVLAALTLAVMPLMTRAVSPRKRGAPPAPPPAYATTPSTRRQAQRQPAYWCFAGSVFLVVLAQAGYAAHSVLIYGELSGGLATGAWLSALAATCGLGARIALFVWPTAWSPPTLAAIIYGVEALGLGLLAAGWIVPGAMLFGACATLTLMLEPLLAAHLLGSTTYGTLYGPIYAGTRVAAALGALVYGASYTGTGSYTPVLWSMAGGLAVASGAIWGVRPLTEHARGEKQPVLE